MREPGPWISTLGEIENVAEETAEDAFPRMKAGDRGDDDKGLARRFNDALVGFIAEIVDNQQNGTHEWWLANRDRMKEQQLSDDGGTDRPDGWGVKSLKPGYKSVITTWSDKRAIGQHVWEVDIKKHRARYRGSFKTEEIGLVKIPDGRQFQGVYIEVLV